MSDRFGCCCDVCSSFGFLVFFFALKGEEEEKCSELNIVQNDFVLKVDIRL